MFTLETIRDNGCGIQQGLQDPLQEESQVVVDQDSLRSIVRDDCKGHLHKIGSKSMHSADSV